MNLAQIIDHDLATLSPEKAARYKAELRKIFDRMDAEKALHTALESLTSTERLEAEASAAVQTARRALAKAEAAIAALPPQS